MNYSVIKPVDIADGPGVRVSLFVSGCRNHCPGCFQPETWDFQYGRPFTAGTVAEILVLLAPHHITGLTILGGDPMEPENQEDVLELCKAARGAYPSKSIWLYTGYHFESYVKNPILQYLDVLVDGPFVEAQKDLSLRFRGSSNQRLIDVPASLEAGHTIPWRDKAYENRMRPTKPGGGFARPACRKECGPEPFDSKTVSGLLEEE